MDGTCFGVDMDEITGIGDLNRTDHREIRLVSFRRHIQRENTAAAAGPRHVLIVKGTTPPAGLLIESTEDIDVPIPPDAVRPLPPLAQTACRNTPIWGVALHQEEIVLLVDAKRVCISSESETSPRRAGT
jgi:chemotaxis signal transduction protein